MANISTLTVSLVAETGKFTNGLKKARKQGKSFGFSMKAAMKGAAIGVGILTTAIGVLVAKSLTLLDQQAKTAKRLGLTQKALVGLALAGEQTGNTQKNLELALQRSTRRIAEAAQGTGEAVKALNELGLSAKKLATLTPDQQFIALSKAFEQVASQSDKIRLGFKLFDSEGVGLINTLALGSDEIERFIQKTADLGVALTDNQLNAIEDSKNAIGLMSAAFTGFGNQITVSFAPAINSVAERIATITELVTKTIPKWTAWAAAIFGVSSARASSQSALTARGQLFS